MSRCRCRPVPVLLLSRGARVKSPDGRGRKVRDTILWRRVLAEFLGSGLLAATVIGSGIAAQTLSPGNADSNSSRTPRPRPRDSSPSS